MPRYPYAEHDNGVVLTQPRNGEFERRPMTAGELAARDTALAIAKDIYRHANQAGACYYEIWLLIAKAIDAQAESRLAALREEAVKLCERWPLDPFKMQESERWAKHGLGNAIAGTCNALAAAIRALKSNPTGNADKA